MITKTSSAAAPRARALENFLLPPPPAGSGQPTVTSQPTARRRRSVCRSIPIRARSPSLHEWVKTTGAEVNEARIRMTRVPKGAGLILNKVSGAPGFWIGNVIVMPGVPRSCRRCSMRWRLSSRSASLRADAREGDIGMQLGEIAKANPAVAIGSYPFFDLQHGPNTNVVLRARHAQKLAQAKREVEEMLERVRRAQTNS
jgi:molybdopterin-biosynthesis enzyme MoeA-like protein